MPLKSPTADEQLAVSSGNNHIATFLYSLLYNFGAGLGIFFLFCLLSQHLINIPAGIFNWIIPLLKTRHQDVLEHCGLDAYSILRFLRMFLSLFGGFAVAVPLTLIPLHFIDQRGLSGLDSASISNLKDKSRIWGHAVTIALVSGCFVLIVARELRDFHTLRNDYLLKQSSNRTLLLTELPKELRDSAALSLLFNSFPGGVSGITSLKHTKKLARLRDQRRSLISRLEVFVLKNLYALCKSKRCLRRSKSTSTEQGQLASANRGQLQRRKTMLHITPPFPNFSSRIVYDEEAGPTDSALDGPRLSSLLLDMAWGVTSDLELSKQEKKVTQHVIRLCDAITELSRRIQLEREGLVCDSSAGAFVTFSTVLGARLANQSLCYPKPITVTANVHPSNVVWENLHISPYMRGMRVLLFKCFVAFLILFWAIPVTLISSLASLTTIAAQFEFLGWILDLPSFILSFIQGFIPSALISVMINILLRILLITTKWEGARQHTDIQLSIMDKHFTFLLFNVLFVVTFASGAINSIVPIINNPPSALDTLAQEMPKVATFFIVFLSFQSLVNLPLELLSPFSSTMRSIKSRHWEFLTPRGFLDQKPTIVPIWGWIWPTHTLVVAITLTYATLSPSILFFAVIYFAAAYFVTLYKIVCVFQPGPECESSGLFFVKALKQSFACIYIAQTIVFSVIMLNKQFGPTLIVFLTIVFTGCVHSYCNRNYLPAIEEIPVHTLLKDLREKAQMSDGAESAAAVATSRMAAIEEGDTMPVVREQSSFACLTLASCHEPSLVSFEHPSLLESETPPIWLPDMFPLDVSEKALDYIRFLFQIFNDRDIPFTIGKGFNLNVDTRELVADLSAIKS